MCIEELTLLLQTYDAREGEVLAMKYDKLNWRIISKPGGATVRPDEFYNLYGYVSHVQHCVRSSPWPANAVT